MFEIVAASHMVSVRHFRKHSERSVRSAGCAFLGGPKLSAELDNVSETGEKRSEDVPIG
jgi:hypothetical protein